MAKKKSSATEAETDETTSAEVTTADEPQDATPESMDTGDDQTAKPDDATDDISDEASEPEGHDVANSSEDTEITKTHADDPDAGPVDDQPDADDTPLSDTTVTTEPSQPPTETVRTETVVERKGGFVPMVLGGILAGALGFGAAYYVLPQTGQDDVGQQQIRDRLEAQAARLSDLSDTVSALPPAQDISGIEAAQGDLSASVSSLSDRLGALEQQMSALDSRLIDVEKRPITEGASDAAVAAYERELKALQDAMAAQRAEIEAMANEAQSLEQSAEETAQATLRRAALTRIQTALDTGEGFAPALADLQGADVEVPAALSDVAAEGVSSLADLQASFPDAARAALAASRRAVAGTGEESGFSAFLKNQLGTRSLEPREGDDPDAVLSRAEAAVREGRLIDALAETEALPEAGRAELSDWAARTQSRLDALAAAEALGNELN